MNRYIRLNRGIYSITNKVSGKLYIGWTKSFKTRFRNHKIQLNKRTHKNSHLQRAWNLYGEESFKFERIEYCKMEYMIEREDYWCKLLNTHNEDYGYNIQETGYGAHSPMLGKTHSEETRKKISQNRKGKLKGESNPFYGKHHSEETKRKISESKKGVPLLKARGRKITPEQSAHLSKIRKGRKQSEETKQKIREKRKESPNTKENLNYARKFYEKEIVSIDSNGFLVKIYSTIKEGAEDTKSDHSYLSKCCGPDEKRKTSKGLYWMYKKEFEVLRKTGGIFKGLKINVQ